MEDRSVNVEKEKAFNNFTYNGVHLNFPNGNRVSMIWGAGSYTDNYNVTSSFKDFESAYITFMQSNNVEVLVNCSSRLLKRLEKKFNDENPFKRLTIEEWLYVTNAVAKDDNKFTGEIKVYEQN